MDDDDFNSLLVCAFRYALHRKTYVTEEIADIVLRYLPKLSINTRDILKREIIELLNRKEFISTVDLLLWNSVLKDIESYERNNQTMG